MAIFTPVDRWPRLREKDIRGVALTHSSEEPSPSPASSPGGRERLKGGKLQLGSGSETHQWPPCWPVVGTGRSHWGFQLDTEESRLACMWTRMPECRVGRPKSKENMSSKPFITDRRSTSSLPEVAI
ncbi:hypothetical protein EYF80_030793 [Liparis tanakae]|uniref:Uncharacterized protein n=1 Tax=Liparis tanakae TaxID=230148 RepID=A0A4Z2GZQ1_9TELE|nr:hypothetical protein EYF80_030793 [Liparis tanakae]